MSAAVLREAAALMHQRHADMFGSGTAWAVTECRGDDQATQRALGTYSLVHDDVAEVAIVRGMSIERRVVAEYIASWHPAVALALAAWLDQMADMSASGNDLPAMRGRGLEEALAVATAYLGRTDV